MTDIQNPTDGPIHLWFGLSYSNYQVLHRTLMQSMPTEWQERMAACLEELQAAYWHIEQPECFEVQAATEHIVGEMTNAELRQAGILADWYGGETFPGKTMPSAEFDEWRAKHETDEPVYSRDGEELDRHQRVTLPAADPIPHYRHAYIEPRLCDRCKGSGTDPEHVATEDHGDTTREIPTPCSACQLADERPAAHPAR